MHGCGGLPLESFNRSVPPGWKPYQQHYPYRRWLERLRLWYRQTDLDATQSGPAVASRLTGRPFNIAMATQITTQLGTVLRGDAALAHEGEGAQYDGNGVLLQAATEGGLQTLLRELTRRYGADAQQLAGASIDTFLELRRGRLPLLEYITEHEYTLDEAHHLSGFELNQVGKSWFLFKHAGLDQARHDQLLLLIGHDLTRYEELKQHLERITKAAQPASVQCSQLSSSGQAPRKAQDADKHIEAERPGSAADQSDANYRAPSCRKR